MSSPSSLDEIPNHPLRLPLWDKASAEFYFAKSRELLSRPFPSARVPHNSCRNLNTLNNDRYPQEFGFANRYHNMSFEDSYYRPHSQYRDRTLTKSENMARKTYTDHRRRLEANQNFNQESVHSPQYYETSYVYYKTENLGDTQDFVPRPRTLSFSDTQEPIKKRNGRSVKDRNRRRQSYNPKAYESSSSESECISVGSVDFDWRRRRRMCRLSGSNTSIRSEIPLRSTNPFLKPTFNAKMMGRSPPPSNSILSGLSPTSAARCLRSSHSTSSDSSL